MNYAAEKIEALRGYTIEWAEPGNYYLSRRDSLYHSNSLDGPFRHVASVHAPIWKRLAAKARLGARLLRFMATNVLPLANGDIFVTFDKSVGVIRNGKYRHLDGLIRPCRVLRAACAVDGNGDVYFGEYLANGERGPMHIYRYSTGADSLDIAYTFPANSVRHIHGIYFDRFDNALICLTGDESSECRMLRTVDGFRTMEAIGEGDETWRAVSMLFSEEAIYFGMDAEFRTNQIFRLDRRTGERRSLGEVDGTVFYSKRLGDDMFFATTAEDAPAQKENVAAVWHTDGTSLSEIARFRKDRHHKILFMFGTIHFPYFNSPDEPLYFSVVGVEQDNSVFRIVRSTD